MNTTKALYHDASEALETRVEDLLSRMTLDEKCAQLGSLWVFQVLEDSTFSEAKARDMMPDGIGQITRIGGATTFSPKDAADMANTIQKYLQERTRFGIPAIMHEECCSGLMAKQATLFPQAIGVAAAWNPELTEKMARVIRTQIRAIGAHQGLSPVLDVTRDPRWGRTEETLGEDPYLVARLGCAYVQGLQGDDLKQGVIATGKHFVGYGDSEGGMNWAPAHIPERELHEVYLYPFEAAVKESGLASIMNSYGEIDGLPCCASKQLFRDILRTAWGFEGIVVSDYAAIDMLHEYHQSARNKQSAAAQALRAGIDVELPCTDCYGAPLKHAIEQEILTGEDLDAAVKHVLAVKFRMGLFEDPYITPEQPLTLFENDAHRDISYQMAADSLVLLKNDGILPLSPDTQSIALIGPNADSWRDMIGDYAYPCHLENLIEMKRAENPLQFAVPDTISEMNDALKVTTVLEAILKRIPPQTEVLFAQGCDVSGYAAQGLVEAVESAKKADVALLVVGGKSGVTPDCTSGESRDRVELGLPGIQEELIKAIYNIDTPIIVVLVHGRPYTLDWVHNHVQAIMSAWLPGEEGGDVIADAIFGHINPGGKLPMSFPHSVGQIPVYYSHKPSGGRSQWSGHYVEMSADPLYPFGHGLSYTTFRYSNLQLDTAEIAPHESLRIALDIENTGERGGDEVVQLYIRNKPDQCSITRPVKELKGFTRLHLDTGEQKRVTFTLYAPQLAFHHEDMRYAVSPGEIDVMLGSSSQDIRLTGTFRIRGEAALDVHKKVFFSDVTVE